MNVIVMMCNYVRKVGMYCNKFYNAKPNVSQVSASKSLG